MENKVENGEITNLTYVLYSVNNTVSINDGNKNLGRFQYSIKDGKRVWCFSSKEGVEIIPEQLNEITSRLNMYNKHVIPVLIEDLVKKHKLASEVKEASAPTNPPPAINYM